jgi:hypothetical protein
MGVTYTTATGATYVPLQTYTVSGSSTTSVSFSTVSASYTDLVAIVKPASSINDYSMRMRFNSDTTTNYSYTSMYGNGTTAYSGRGTTQDGIRVAINLAGIGTSLNTNNMFTFNIMNYANTTTYKSVLCRASAQNDGGTNVVEAGVGLWRATPAIISTITFDLFGANFVANSTFSLYGILGA